MQSPHKLVLVSFLIIGTAGSHLLAEQPTLQSMTIKLAKLEVDITKQKLKLMKRETALNEMKVKALQSHKIDKKNMAIKLAEIEAGLAKDHLLLSEREVKLFEMKVALVKEKNK